MAKAELSTAFEHTHLPHGDDGKRVRGIIARCGNCAAAIPLPCNTMGKGFAETEEVEWKFVARKLEAKGWQIGRRRQDHRCPRCQKNAQLAVVTNTPRAGEAPEQSAARTTAARRAYVFETNRGKPYAGGDLKLVKDAFMNSTTQVLPAATTKKLDREDRRIIIRQLEEVYVDEKVGYSDGWSDEKVAQHLGVPRAWVRLLREENFGDEVASESIREKVKEAQELVAKIRALQPALDEARKLLGLADTMERELAQIAKVVK